MDEWQDSDFITCGNCDEIYFKSQGACPVCDWIPTSVNKVTANGDDIIMKKPKQKSKKVIYYGIEFDSKIEGQRYLYLRSLAEDGIILDLIPSETKAKKQYELVARAILSKNELRPKIRIQARITYTPDFEYIYQSIHVIEDVKDVYGNSRKNRAKRIVGKAIVTPASRLRHKLLQAKFPDMVFKIVTNSNQSLDR